MSLAFYNNDWQTRRVLIGLFTELDAPGGVQRAGRHLAAMLSEYAASHGMECRLLSLNDSPELHRMSVGVREFVFTGAAGSKARFTAAALRAGRRHPKFVLAGHPNLGPVVQAMRLTAPRVKSVIWTHGVEVWEPLSALRQKSLRRATLVGAPSRDTANHVAGQQHVPENRLRVIPWALDPEFETQLAESGSNSLPANFPSGRVILTVGRWISNERYKGMDTLITALPRLLLRFPDVNLVAVGEGDDRKWLEHMAEKNGVRRHVYFFSGLSSAELSACYAASELFALPSRGEGFGLVYLEAMAREKAVIAGAHGGAPEVIDDGATGYLVQHGDPVQLATSIETLLENPALAKQMGERGKQRVLHEFRFGVFAKSVKKVFRELCES